MADVCLKTGNVSRVKEHFVNNYTIIVLTGPVREYNCGLCLEFWVFGNPGIQIFLQKIRRLIPTPAKVFSSCLFKVSGCKDWQHEQN